MTNAERHALALDIAAKRSDLKALRRDEARYARRREETRLGAPGMSEEFYEYWLAATRAEADRVSALLAEMTATHRA